MAVCDFTDFATNRLDRLATQYRESTNLRSLVEIVLNPVEEVGQAMCDTPDAFDIDTATGVQLTALGSLLGWTRTQCQGARRPAFGFDCGLTCTNDTSNIGGFCDAWNCADGDWYEDSYTFTDDDLYRRTLRAVIYRNARRYSRASLTAAAQALFDDTNAGIFKEEPGNVHIHSGRPLTGDELSIPHLLARTLPVPPGIRAHIWSTDGLPFGFGTGWGEFCTGSIAAYAG